MFIRSCRWDSGGGRIGERGWVGKVVCSISVIGSFRISAAEPFLSSDSRSFDFALASMLGLCDGGGMFNCCFRWSNGFCAEAGVTSGRLLGTGGDKGSARCPVVVAYSCSAASTGSAAIGAAARLELCRLSFFLSSRMNFLRSCMNGATT